VNLFRLGWRWLLRDLRHGEVGLLMVAAALAAAAVTTVDFFADRVERALAGQVSNLLAADAALEWSEPPLPEWEAEARARGLRTARTMSFPSVVLHDDATLLVQVKAVSGGYPLRGRLRSSAGLDDDAGESAPPAPGAAWAEPRLFAQLGIAPGAAIAVGERELPVTRVVREEPDRGGDLFQIAPRLLLRAEDIPATGLVGPASRVSYRLLVAGDEPAVRAYGAWLAGRLPKGAEWLDPSRARPELQTALDRGTRLLSIAAGTVVLLAGAAALLAVRRFVERQVDAAAVLRCLGASSRTLVGLVALRLGGVALAAAAIGGLIGLGAQSALGALVGQWFAAELPPPSTAPLINAVLTTVLVLGATALPPLLRLRDTPPARVLRRELGPPPGPALVAGGVPLAGLAAFFVWRMGDLDLGMRALAGVLATLLALSLAAYGLTRLLGPLRARGRGAWRQGIAALVRHPVLTAVQTVGFGLGILALLLLAVVRVDLLSAWQDKLPAGTPNHFLINIQPAERQALEHFLADQGIAGAAVLPMIRARLVEIAGRPVDPSTYPSARAQRLASREFNLSHADRPQPDNRVVAGRWWGPGAATPELSVETGIAETLGIALGDRLTFDVSGTRVAGTVTSLRRVQWDSFNVNFFVVGTPGLLAGQPATFVTSFHLPPGRLDLLPELSRRFPSVTAIDVGAVLGQVRAMADQAARALEYVLAFTLAAGVIVLLASVQASRDVRAREIAVLRTLGASRRRLYSALAVEFALLGLLAGTVAALGALGTGWLISEAVLGLPYAPSLRVLPLGALGGMLGVGLAGLVAVRRLVDTPPVAVLRAA
jgi:putative ABC transport system permease protein